MQAKQAVKIASVLGVAFFGAMGTMYKLKPETPPLQLLIDGAMAAFASLPALFLSSPTDPPKGKE